MKKNEQNARILHDICQKNILPVFGGSKCSLPPSPTPMCNIGMHGQLLIVVRRLY